MDGRRNSDMDDGGAGAAGRRIRQVWLEHDLTRRELAATQRAVRTLARRGAAPAPDRFWEHTALPRAAAFADAVRAGIDRERGMLVASGAATGGVLAAALPPVTALDDLGHWWLDRLRRAATVAALPRVLSRPPSAVGRVVDHHEMRLLDRAPWSHGDRLLSAFELAHADLRRYAVQQLAGRPIPAGRGGTPDLVLCGPVGFRPATG